MTTAMIAPQPDGTAVFELNGMTHEFPSLWAALTEGRSRQMTCTVLPFPNPSIEVVAVAPALRVLT